MEIGVQGGCVLGEWQLCKEKEGGRIVQRENYLHVISTESSAVPAGVEMGDPTKLSCFGEEDWAFILCPSVNGLWLPWEGGVILGKAEMLRMV